MSRDPASDSDLPSDSDSPPQSESPARSESSPRSDSTLSVSSRSVGDDSLTRRIAVTLAVVLVADALFVAVLVSLLRPWLLPVVGPLSGVAQFTVAALAALALAWLQLKYTRREALAAVDARQVSADERPDLHRRLQRLAQTAGVTSPRLAIAQTELANSFTVGDLRGGTVVVSTGLLDALDEDELDAVLAHELAHLQNRDAAVMTLATFLPALANDDYSLFSDTSGATRTLALGVAAVVGYAVSTALVGAPVFSLASFAAFAGFAVLTVLFGGVALGLLALPVVVLSGRLSRDREFAADRAGALLAGNPAAMATALETLDADAPDRPNADVRAGGVRSGGVQELCFLPHGIVSADGVQEDSQNEREDPLAGLPVEVATHPATEERIARLRDLEVEG